MSDTSVPRTPRYRKVFVVAPANRVTGGPESLHQLVDGIRSLGGEAFMSYFPFDAAAEVPEPYRGYNVSAAPPEDEPGNLIVLPESMPCEARLFSKATTAVWWLSVDNFFLVEDRPGWDELRRHVHFAQSEYAMRFLAAQGIAGQSLTDYANEVFLQPQPAVPRRNATVYNIKSLAMVWRLRRRAFPLRVFEWISVDGLSREQVRALLSGVKLYIDFGHHPGRDRMPREAAICGACVLTGRRGSAAFDADIPIPQRYKLDESSPLFPLAFARALLSIVLRFERHAPAFEDYRRFIRSGRAVFRDEVGKAFFR